DPAQVASCSLLGFVLKYYCFTDHAIDCCLTTTGQFLPRHIAVSYTMQEKSACRIPATVFITRKNKKICSPPLEDARYPWVKKLITHLDNLNGKNGDKHNITAKLQAKSSKYL
uniref:Chemokine interleukin-8-like domain-containing protein n=1 Tax=Electrophorus electricus TaxID=8005 RepID=A0A4W4F2Q9_ELEEL